MRSSSWSSSACWATLLLITCVIAGCGPDRRADSEQQPTQKPPAPADVAVGSASARNSSEATSQTARAIVDCTHTSETIPAAAIAELRTTAESSSFFAALSTTGTLRTCTASTADKKVVLDYGFSDGGVLHVERDAGIEFSLHDARFAAPQKLDARDVLRRMERTLFGAEGCGINWAEGSNQAAPNDSAPRETTYRGDTCNCQARVRNDQNGNVVGLLLRSAC